MFLENAHRISTCIYLIYFIMNSEFIVKMDVYDASFMVNIIINDYVCSPIQHSQSKASLHVLTTHTHFSAR